MTLPIGCASPSLRSIAITPATGTETLTVGQTVQYTAIGSYEQGTKASTTQNITSSVSWTSGNTAVATINSSGVVTAVSAGTAVITASASGFSGLISTTSNVTVSGVSRQLGSLSISPSSQTVAFVGNTVQFDAIGTYTSGTPATQDLTTQAAWISSAPSIAIVNSSGVATGVATAVGAGTATITASAQAQNGSIINGTATINVASSTSTGLSSIAIIPSTQAVTVVGETAQFVAIGTYASGSPATQNLTSLATWRSSDSTVAAVNSSTGLVTADGPGTATITATANSQNGAAIVGTATVTVASGTAAGLSSITVIPGAQTVGTVGETAQYIAIGTFTGVVPPTPPTQDVTNSVTWVSSDVKVATINSAGLATENSVGTTAITAVGKSATGSVVTGAATFTAAGTIPGVPVGPVAIPTLEVYKVGNNASVGTVTNSPAPPVTCGTSNTCTGNFPLNTTVTLTAVPGASTFGGWSSNCSPISATSCTIVMSNNEAVGAIFY